MFRGNCITMGFCPLFLSKLTPSISRPSVKHSMPLWGCGFFTEEVWVSPQAFCPETEHPQPGSGPASMCPVSIQELVLLFAAPDTMMDLPTCCWSCRQTAVRDFCSVCSCHLILLVTALTSSDRRHKELNSLKGEELAISAGRRKLGFCLKAAYVWCVNEVDWIQATAGSLGHLGLPSLSSAQMHSVLFSGLYSWATK